MTRLLLFYSIAVAVIISPLCSGESQWSQSNAVAHEERTKIVYSSRVAWNSFHSHFRVQYKVLTASYSLRISYSRQCAKSKRSIFTLWKKKWYYTNPDYIDMNLDLNPSQDTKTACVQLYDIDEKPKCNQFRLKIKIEYTSEEVDHLTLTDACSTNSSETRYTANCNFDGKDSCGYRNDLCSLVPWKFNDFVKDNTDDIKPLQDLDTPISCDLLSKLDLTVLQPPEFVSEEKKKRSVETPETRIAKSVSNGNYLFIEGRGAGENVVTGIINSPILTKHAQYNKVLQFGYTFEHSGVHSLVVALVCVSNGDRILHLQDDFTHFRMSNGVEQPMDLSGEKCLDIHTFLNGCEKFKVQFVGGARSSRLIIDDIYYGSSCPYGKYDNR